ncbi:MAG: helix-turn-helix domain-containing protein [Candidatus Woesearchaeota archaeon]|nr:helix-turn-helix domain-containing protein [Candidatus Woesearchaeota archaeon]
MAIEEALENIGLSRQEAFVYISTLKLGMTKASRIAQKAGLKREAVYYILKQLQEKGFVSEVIKSGVKYYSAVPPQRILGIIEEEKQQKTEAIKEILPDIEALQKIAFIRPQIEIYEGVKGYKTIIAKLVEKKSQEICSYVPEAILHFLPTFSLQFRRKRKEKKIHMRVISEKTNMIKELQKKDKEELREIRFNDKIIKNIKAAYYILPDAVIIIRATEKEQLGIYIREESTAKLQKNIFEQIWKESLR